MRLGDLLVIDIGAEADEQARELPIEWVVVQVSGKAVRLLPADTNLACVGSADVVVQESAASGPLVLRSSVDPLDLSTAALAGVRATGRVDEALVERAVWKASHRGAAESLASPEALETDGDDDYLEWIELLERAAASLRARRAAPTTAAPLEPEAVAKAPAGRLRLSSSRQRRGVLLVAALGLITVLGTFAMRTFNRFAKTPREQPAGQALPMVDRTPAGEFAARIRSVRLSYAATPASSAVEVDLPVRVERYSPARSASVPVDGRSLAFVEFDGRLACPAILGEDAILIECSESPAGGRPPDGGIASPVVLYGAAHVREAYAHGVIGRVVSEDAASFLKLGEFRLAEVPSAVHSALEQRSWRNGSTERFGRWAKLCQGYRTWPDPFGLSSCAWMEAYAVQNAFAIAPAGKGKGCAADGGATLAASAYVPSPGVIRFFVRRSDDRPWTSDAKLILYVGDGPMCAARPPNVVKQTSPVTLGDAVQTINLRVDPYEGEWSEHEEKTFWIGVQENGWNSHRASAVVRIRRNELY